LTVEDTLAYEQTCMCDTTLPSDASRSEPRVLTFTELKDLIEQGKTDQIPNNRVIPVGLNVCIVQTLYGIEDANCVIIVN
jgi:hypothetical protein